MLKWLISWFGIVGEFLGPVLDYGFRRELALALPFALPAVRAAADRNDIAGRERSDAAFQEILSQLMLMQIVVAAETIWFAIDLAYRKFRAEGGENTQKVAEVT